MDRMNNQHKHSMMNSAETTGSSMAQTTAIQRVGLGLQHVSINQQQLHHHQQQINQQVPHYQQHQQVVFNTSYQSKSKRQGHNGIEVNNGVGGNTGVINHQYMGNNGVAAGVIATNGNHQLSGSPTLTLDNSQHNLTKTQQYIHHQQSQLQSLHQHQLQNHAHYQHHNQQPTASQQTDLQQLNQSLQQLSLHQQQHNNEHVNHHKSSHRSLSYQNQSQHVQNHEQRDRKQQHNHHQQRHYSQKNQNQPFQPKHILQKPKSGARRPVSAPVQNTSNTTVIKIQKKPVLNLEEPLLVIDTFDANGNLDQDDCDADESQVEEKSPNSEETRSNCTSENSEEPSLANTKEKTPMCLINELARFNKISHQYTLVDEQGPAHKKIFYVKLKLGEEEYSASGESIKKAQHAAAAIALVETGHPHPPPKPPRLNANVLCVPDENITPTVELNALAMKRGEATTYKAIEPQQPPYYPQPGMDPRGMYNQRYQFMRATRDPRYRGGGGVLWPLRYHYPRMSKAFYVSLRVGHREFIGDGPTRQAARHNAAQKALRILKSLPIQNEPKEPPASVPSEQVDSVVTGDGEEEADKLSVNDGLKSEISLVHEVALRRNMLVTFEVIRETGPPHMKTFVTRCTVSEHVTEGEGNSKKTSKKKAADLMLEALKKLPPTAAPIIARPKCKVQINKKKNRNIIKCELQQQKADPNYGVGINPISRLIQIMQAKKKKEPVYTLVSERGLPRRREFVMQVEVEEKTCTGTGPNKKLAKRSAAEAMLLLLGYTKPSPQPIKSSIKSTSGEGHSNGDKKVHFVGDTVELKDKTPAVITTSSPTTPVVVTQQHQRVPGILHLPPGSTGRVAISSTVSPSVQQPKEPLVNLASILKPSLRPEIQLRELCKALDQQLEIDDFTKKRPSGTEHITRITVGTDPGQSFHGSSNTLESSRDAAAMEALKLLLGRVKELHPGGDGPPIKRDLLTRSSMS